MSPFVERRQPQSIVQSATREAIEVEPYIAYRDTEATQRASAITERPYKIEAFYTERSIVVAVTQRVLPGLAIASEAVEPTNFNKALVDLTTTTSRVTVGFSDCDATV